MDKIQMELFEQLTGLHQIPEGAYNIRANSQKDSRNTTENIDIVTKDDKDGIDIYVKPGTKNESVHESGALMLFSLALTVTLQTT